MHLDAEVPVTLLVISTPLTHAVLLLADGLCVVAAVVCLVQVLSDDVPVEPEEVEALVGSRVEEPLRHVGVLGSTAAANIAASSSGSESESQEPLVVVSAAVA